MKIKAIQYFGLAVVLLSFFGNNTWATETSPFLKNLQTLVQGCTVRTYTQGTNGLKVYGPLKSHCAEVRSFGAKAEIILDNEKYTVTLAESPLADGGDLDNIEIQDSNGVVVAQLSNVLAFGDILLGLAGADVELPELHVQTLDSE
jgi:hypothetical protein